MQPLSFSKFRMYKVDPNDLEVADDLEFSFILGSRFRAVNVEIDEPAVQVNFEDFYKGQDSVTPLSKCCPKKNGFWTRVTLILSLKFLDV